MKINFKLLILSIIVAALSLFLTGASSHTLAEDKLILSIPESEKISDGPLLKFFRPFIPELYKRTTIELSLGFYPMERMFQMANDDETVNGTVGPVNLNNFFQNLTRIEPPIVSVKITAWSANPDIRVKGWGCLRNSEYRIECVIGARDIISAALRKLSDEGLLAEYQAAAWGK